MVFNEEIELTIKASYLDPNTSPTLTPETVSIRDIDLTDLDLSVDQSTFGYIGGANFLFNLPQNPGHESKKTKQTCLNEEEISDFMKKFNLTRKQIHGFHAEFLAYDSDGNGVITLRDLHIVNRVFGGNMKKDKDFTWSRPKWLTLPPIPHICHFFYTSKIFGE